MSKVQSSVLARFFRLEPARRRLIVSALVNLTAASLVLAVSPFRSAIRFGSVPLANVPGSLEDCVWAVEAVAWRLPWRAVCIHKGLALQRLLRRCGVDALLHYGVGKDDAEGALQAHVWVTLDGKALIGGSEAAKFAPIAVYP